MISGRPWPQIRASFVHGYAASVVRHLTVRRCLRRDSLVRPHRSTRGRHWYARALYPVLRQDHRSNLSMRSGCCSKKASRLTPPMRSLRTRPKAALFDDTELRPDIDQVARARAPCHRGMSNFHLAKGGAQLVLHDLDRVRLPTNRRVLPAAAAGSFVIAPRWANSRARTLALKLRAYRPWSSPDFEHHADLQSSSVG